MVLRRVSIHTYKPSLVTGAEKGVRTQPSLGTGDEEKGVHTHQPSPSAGKGVRTYTPTNDA